MRHFISILAIGLFLLTCTILQAQQNPDNKQLLNMTKEVAEILKKVDTTIKSVSSVRYTGSYRGTGWQSRIKPTSTGTVLMVSGAGRGLRQFHFDTYAKFGGSDETLHFTIGGNDKKFFLIDWQNKIAHHSYDPKVIGRAGRIAQTTKLIEFVHPTPFDDEINADHAKLLASAKVGDEDCYVIHVNYSQGRGEAIWYFSKKDFLPRRVDRVFLRDGERGTTELIITNLVVSPKIKKNELQLTLPEGFKETEDFAPDNRRSIW